MYGFIIMPKTLCLTMHLGDNTNKLESKIPAVARLPGGDALTSRVW
jgi:hypothetical protein